MRYGVDSVRPRKQAREKLGAICRGLHQRLIEQMLEHVLTPDVDDEGNLRSERNDVREVLFGPHAHVHTARLQRFQKSRNHVLISRLVRQKVIRWEIPARLGELRNQTPEFLVSEKGG